MKLLVVTGPVDAAIDSVRRLTNRATGATGWSIAAEASLRGHEGVLLTSRPRELPGVGWAVQPFDDFNDLYIRLKTCITTYRPDVLVMAAAVCDYLVDGLKREESGPLEPIHGKIGGHAPQLWLKLIPAPRLVDLSRSQWGFTGKLVVFKLETGVDLPTLLMRAEATRTRCHADIAVANLLETANDEAWIGPNQEGHYELVIRSELPSRLLNALALNGKN
jgi:phosphopantothenate---cysteine ligase (CTP)